MTGINYDICYTQQRIYKYMCQQGYDMKTFSDAYLQSDFCRRAMDTNYSRFQLETALECADFYMPEIEDKLKKLPDGEKFDLDIAEWIGFTYRQLYIVSKKPSSILADAIPFETMVHYYPGMHTIDEDKAAEIILHNAFTNEF